MTVEPARREPKPAAELSKRVLDAWLVDAGFATSNGHALEITPTGLEVAWAISL